MLCASAEALFIKWLHSKKADTQVHLHPLDRRLISIDHAENRWWISYMSNVNVGCNSLDCAHRHKQVSAVFKWAKWVKWVKPVQGQGLEPATLWLQSERLPTSVHLQTTVWSAQFWQKCSLYICLFAARTNVLNCDPNSGIKLWITPNTHTQTHVAHTHIHTKNWIVHVQRAIQFNRTNSWIFDCSTSCTALAQLCSSAINLSCSVLCREPLFHQLSHKNKTD